MESWARGLSAAERGYVAGAALAGAGSASGPEPEAAADVAGAAGDRCRAALTRLDGLPRHARAASLARLLGENLAPVPAGLASVHESWLCAALEPHPSALVVALVAGLAPEVRAAAQGILAGRGESLDGVAPYLMAPEALAEIRRAAFLEIRPPPEPGSGSAAELCALAPEALMARVASSGTARLGAELAGAPRALTARAVVHGLRSIAAGLDDEGVRQVAQRLPRPVGLALLRAHAGR